MRILRLGSLKQERGKVKGKLLKFRSFKDSAGGSGIYIHRRQAVRSAELRDEDDVAGVVSFGEQQILAVAGPGEIKDHT
jgi:hypothetical protein